MTWIQGQAHGRAASMRCLLWQLDKSCRCHTSRSSEPPARHCGSTHLVLIHLAGLRIGGLSCVRAALHTFVCLGGVTELTQQCSAVQREVRMAKALQPEQWRHVATQIGQSGPQHEACVEDGLLRLERRLSARDPRSASQSHLEQTVHNIKSLLLVQRHPCTDALQLLTVCRTQ
jgi:hypothetical protein